MRLTTSILTALMLLSFLMMPVAEASRPAFAQEDSRCLKFGDCEVVTCNPNGTYTYTFQITNASAVPATQAEFVLVNPPGAVITPNPYPLSPPLLPGQSKQITVTISGAAPGQLCFGLTIHDERKLNCCTALNKCVKLPQCGGTETAVCRDGVCCSRAPQYDQTMFVGQKVAAVTGWSLNPALTPPNAVLTVFDLSGANAFSTTANNTPLKYNGPASSRWTLTNLGSIFGLTIDHQGNIYVTASSAYNGDAYPQGAGRIYKIANGSGAISNFNAVQLPNSADPSITTASEAFPALGNISFDCAHKQFFVTNLEDGRIYRLNYAGGVDSAFDHKTGVIAGNGNPEAGDGPGFAPLGERLWGVQVHNNRVYYSVWAEDCGNHNANPAVKNEIWSIGLNSLGDFVPGDQRKELAVPDLQGDDFSNPTSDISFSRDGKMLLAERTMYSPTAGLSATSPNAHGSRVLEYACTPSGWSLTSAMAGLPYKYNLGVSASSSCPVASAAKPANAAGGIDYDYDPAATFGVWSTGDILKASPLIYGLQGFPLAGGGTGLPLNNSALAALYGLGGFKTQIGDVEVSCPPGSSPY